MHVEATRICSHLSIIQLSSTYLAIYLAIYYLSPIHTHISVLHIYTALSIHPHIYLPICLYVYLSICPSVLPSLMSTIHKAKPFEKKELYLGNCPVDWLVGKPVCLFVLFYLWNIYVGVPSSLWEVLPLGW